jgi:hypothetical protein
MTNSPQEFGTGDTVCIDKTSSTELSEAINSMFRWYQEAAVCYVHLSDVSRELLKDSVFPRFSKCRWLTRGWTLQELIAPEEVRFYSGDWHFLATKEEIAVDLSALSGIPVAVLRSGNVSGGCQAASRCNGLPTEPRPVRKMLPTV